jgi:A/G-specific adenine glycosylase
MWQGLGYNRRAKYLQETAKIWCEAKSPGGGSRGRVYLSRSRELFAQRLPGVGPYTRGAVLAFAYNRTEVFVETNIRTVLFHHLQKSAVHYRKISDAELLPLVAALLKKSKMPPREFYWAMMDYGSSLKRRGVKLNAHSAHYVRQGKFEGSARQLRGAILRELLKKPLAIAQLTKNLARKRGEVETQLRRLAAEGILKKKGNRWAIA